MNWILFAAAVLCAGVTRPAHADAPVLAPCLRTYLEPLINGKLDDAIWTRSAELTSFIDIDGKTPAAAQTTGRLMWDRNYLYVGIVCHHADARRLVAQRDKNDQPGIRNDDSVEIFLQPQPGGDVFHIIINAIGAVYDERRENEPDSWSSGATVATSFGADNWIVECRIPFANIGETPAEHERWAFNLCRHDTATGEQSSWAGDWHHPEAFGAIEFRQDGALLRQASIVPAADGEQIEASVLNVAPNPAKVAVALLDGAGAAAAPLLVGPYEERKATVPISAAAGTVARVELKDGAIGAALMVSRVFLNSATGSAAGTTPETKAPVKQAPAAIPSGRPSPNGRPSPKAPATGPAAAPPVVAPPTAPPSETSVVKPPTPRVSVTPPPTTTEAPAAASRAEGAKVTIVDLNAPTSPATTKPAPEKTKPATAVAAKPKPKPAAKKAAPKAATSSRAAASKSKPHTAPRAAVEKARLGRHPVAASRPKLVMKPEGKRSVITEQVKQPLPGKTTPPTAPLVTPAAPPVPAPEQGAGLVLPVRPFDRYLYNSPPPLQNLGRSMSITATPGQTEAASFVIVAKTDLQDVGISISDLKGPSGVIPSRYVDLRVVKCWQQRNADGKLVTVPELLLHDDRVSLRGTMADVGSDQDTATDVPAGTLKQIWIDVKVPDNAAAESYVGEVTVQPAGQPKSTLALEVRVLPFRLSETGRQYIIGDAVQIGTQGGPAERTPEQFAEQVRDIRDHGFHTVGLMMPLEQADTAFRVLRRRDVYSPVPFALDDPTPERLGQLKRVAAAAGYSQILVAPPSLLDPATPPDVATCEKTLESIKDAGCRTIAVLPYSVARQLKTTPELTVYPVNSDGLLPYLKGISLGTKRKNHQREFYTWNCTSEDPRVNRLYCGFYLWKSKLDGVFPMYYQVPAPGAADVFNETGEGAVHQRMTTYPSTFGPLPTLQWAAARAGIDDMRYVETLQRLLTKVRAEGAAEAGTPRNLAIARAEKTFVDLGRRIQLYAPAMFPTLKEVEFETLRDEVIAAILGLRSALQTTPPAPETPPSPTTDGTAVAAMSFGQGSAVGVAPH